MPRPHADALNARAHFPPGCRCRFVQFARGPVLLTDNCPVPEHVAPPRADDDAGLVCLYGARPGGGRGPLTYDQLTPGDREALAAFIEFLKQQGPPPTPDEGRNPPDV